VFLKHCLVVVLPYRLVVETSRYRASRFELFRSFEMRISGLRIVLGGVMVTVVAEALVYAFK
jgi:hypothetical protein